MREHIECSPTVRQIRKAGIMKNTKTKRMLAVTALLAVGLALMLYYAAHKQGYHVDELYTYELANYPGGFYALEDGYMDSWHDGSFYSAALTPIRHNSHPHR